MAYRGLDLDLRTPALRPRLAREAGSEVDTLENFEGRRARVQAYSGTRPADPIWVDDTVLACCNHAYDVALAHGSAEVRLEHLVLALTKVEAAARMLEERGFREGQLRRECAALVASEMPTAPVAERGQPRRSDEFADVLRRAAQRAAQRSVAAGVDDVLAVLLAHPDDPPAVLILRAHSPDWSRLPHAALSAPTTTTQRLEPTTVHDPLGLRLDVLEGSLRAVQADFSADRRLLADLARDLKRELGGQRHDLANRLQDFEHGLAERLKSFERFQAADTPIDTRLADLARLWTLTSERMQALERSITSRSPDGTAIAGIADRLGMLGQQWSTVETRLQAMERSWQAREAQAHAAPRTAMERLAEVEAMVHGGLTRVAERLAALESTISHHPQPEAGTDVVDRMSTLERTVISGLQDGARNWAALGQRLQAFEATITAGAGRTDGGLVATVRERLASIERSINEPRGDLADSLGAFGERLAAIERTMVERPVDRANWDHVGDRLTGIEALLTDPKALPDGGRIEQRLKAMEDAVAAQRADAADHRLAVLGQLDTVSSAASQAAGGGALVPVVERLDSLKATAEVRHKETAQTWTTVAERTVGMEAALRHNASAASEASLSHQRDLADVSMTVARLASNQEALQTSVADWRYEQQAETSAMSSTLREILSRLSTLRATNGHATMEGLTAPIAPAGTLASSPAIVTSTVRRLRVRLPDSMPNREGMWRWLFGTDSVRDANAMAEQRWREAHRTWRDRPDT